MENYEISFDIRFITPLLIGGAENNSIGDNDGLTGKALRGCWRFWFRAIAGGCLINPKPDTVSKLEEFIFGSLKKNTFRLAVIPDIENANQNTVNRLPPPQPGQTRNQAPFNNPIRAEASFHIQILPRSGMSEDDRRILLATIWIWAHLGAVGNRSRRGFGSPVISASPASLHTFEKVSTRSETIPNIFTPVLKSFENTNELEKHLTTGLARVITLFSDWIPIVDKDQQKHGDIPNKRPTEQPYFILSNPDQVAIGKEFTILEDMNDKNAALRIVHGTSGEDHDFGFARKIKINGIAINRWASPMYLRIHKITERTGAKYVPVLTWCHQTGVSFPPEDISTFGDLPVLEEFFRRAGFTRTLAGKGIHEFAKT